MKAIETDFADQPLVRTALQHTVATTYREIGRYPPAAPLHEAALLTHRAKLGDDHPNTLAAMQRFTEAEAEIVLRECLRIRRRVPGDDTSVTLVAISDMGHVLFGMGKLAEAEPYWREALEGFRRVLGDDHTQTLVSITNLGKVLNAMGRHQEARTLLEQGEPLARRLWTGSNAKSLGVYLARLGEARTGVGQYTGAESTLLEAHGLLVAGFGEEHERTLKCIERLIGLYNAWHAAEPDQGYDAKAAEWRANTGSSLFMPIGS